MKRKSGKQIVDYFSSFGKEGIQLFVNEAKNRQFYGRPFNYESNLETPKESYNLGLSPLGKKRGVRSSV